MAKRKGPPAASQSDGVSVVVSPRSPNRRIEGKPNEKTQTIYANNAVVELSNWDLRIRLGLIEAATPELVSVTEVAHVYMSHEHARAFAEALTNTLAKLPSLKESLGSKG